jgi:hypothetical protein
MNNKQIALLAGAAAVTWTGLVVLKVLDIIKGWDEAEEAKARHERNVEFMQNLDKVREGLDRQLETAKFWEQVTGDM